MNSQLGTGQRRAPRERGFTIIETTLSMAVMMVVALGVAALFVHSVTNNSGAGERTLAMSVAQQHIERLRSIEFDEINDIAAHNVQGADHTFTVQVNVTPVDTDADDGINTLKRIEVRVTPQADNGGWSNGTVVLWTERASLTLGDNR